MLVVGDVMLDRYWFGDVERISPEAPVPVVLVRRIEERPGGAANVARNIDALGGHATLLSVIGDDEAGPGAGEGARARGGVRASLHRDAGLSTTVKLRVIGHQQQLLRVDFERAPGHEVLAAKLDEFERLVDEADAIVLSDYGKGGLAHVTRMIELGARARQARAGRPQGLRLRPLPGRHGAHAEPRRVPRGGGPLDRRGRPRAPRAEAARRPRRSTRSS